ncbi:hypothetical protein E3V39_10155 [Gammaproteobacteria bacterium LSUCC0112]|nr:hypothetical protein E3V39_10155 [Gammaproteobacteria bacterium LSUCC0112]
MIALTRLYHSCLENRLVRFVLTLLAVWFIFTIFVVPNRLDWIQWWYLFYFPVEAVIFPLLLLIRGRAAGWILGVCSVVIAAGLIFRIADMAAHMIFARAFNPVLDAYLLSDGFHLLGSSIGYAGAVLMSILMVLAVVLIVVVTSLSLARIRTLLWTVPVRWSGGALLLALGLWLVMSMSGSPKASRYFHDQLVSHVYTAVNSVIELRAFRAIVNDDVYTEVPGDQLFGALQGKDVLVIFVESYGRVLLDNTRYASSIRPLLNEATRELSDQGYASSSAFLASSTIGGLSWLAHGTAMSGLWIDSQLRYDALMMSQRPSLIRLFQRAGWRTLGVMPAITLAWPEGQYFGYDQIYDVAGLEYQGLPFNYVTMPDQFTLARFQQRERDPVDRQPVMAEIALISSHAPWTPIPDVIDWRGIVDGAEFNEMAQRGPRTDQVWQDMDLLKSQYRDSVEYVINTLVSYITQYGDEDLVLLIMGDHQPMPLIAEGASAPDVMVHLVSSDPAIMQMVDAWQWTPGMLPADDAPVWRMDSVRDRFIETFSPGMPVRPDAR